MMTCTLLPGQVDSAPACDGTHSKRLVFVVALAGVVATAPSWEVLVAASLLIGAAGGALDAVINAHVALHHGVGRLGLLHAAYGAGATLAPIALAVLVSNGASWRAAYVILGGFEVLVLVGFRATS